MEMHRGWGGGGKERNKERRLGVLRIVCYLSPAAPAHF